MPIRKEIIARAFSGGARSYDKAAQLQQEVAPLVAELALIPTLPSHPNILEIGCGTGGLTKYLLDKVDGGDFLITDISDGMIEQCQRNLTDPRMRFKQMDGENPDLGSQKFDLIVSSLTVQWFQNLEQGLHRLINHLAPDGRLVISTLGEQTFTEWRKAHDDLGLASGIPDFIPATALAMIWPDAHHGQVEEQLITRAFPDAHSFARMLKAIGANTPIDGHRPLTPGSFRKLSQKLGRNFDVTYHVLFGSYRVGL